MYDPQLEYAQGETKSYVKDDFIISVVDDERYDTLTLYTDLDKTSVLNGDEIKLDKDYFFKISYNEKIKPFTIDDIKFEFEKQKYIGSTGVLKLLLLRMPIMKKFSEVP